MIVREAVSKLLARIEPGEAEVLFVFMPIAGVERPTMGVGLLKACLERQGVPAKVVYANVAFAGVVGLANLAFIDRLGKTGPAPEWFFARSAFRERAPDEEESLRRFTDLLELRRILDPVVVRAVLRDIRRKAEEMVEYLAQALVLLKPRVVACSSVFLQHVASLALCRRVAELDASITTMLGGGNCEAEMGLATHRSFPWLDYVVSGEADELIGELCRNAIVRGRPCSADQLALGGYGPCHRADGYPGTGSDRAAAARAVTSAVNDIPPADFDDYFRALGAFPELAEKVTPSLLVETSRGCWWGEKHLCTFCGLNGEGISFRGKTSERVLQDLEVTTRRYDLYRLEAVDNILDMRFFKDLLPALARQGAPYSFFFEVKANLKREQVRLLADAGIRIVQPGIESFDTRILRLMDKGTTAAQNLLLLKWCKQFDVRVTWNFICGFPGERDEWYEEMAGWMPLVEHLTPPTGMAKLQYHRFSVYDTERARYGLRLKPHPHYKLIYPDRGVPLDDLVYLFEDYNEKVAKLLGMVGPRPGLEKVVTALLELRRAAKSASPPFLVAVDTDSELKLLDQRRIRTASVHLLRGPSRRLYGFLEDGPTRNRVESRALAELGLGAAETGRLLDGFLGRKLALEIDGRILGLATRPVPRGTRRIETPAFAALEYPENWLEMLGEGCPGAAVART
jgi:ribosomal peptide maturation radical SAM protein 1